MSYQSERDAFLTRMAQEGLPLHITRALLRAATTLQRLAEAQCNGDYPADNGERKVVECDSCGQAWVRSNLARQSYKTAAGTVTKLICQDCRIVARLSSVLQAINGWQLQTQGDPRGYVLRVIPPSYAERNAGRDVHNLDSIGVPTR